MSVASPSQASQSIFKLTIGKQQLLSKIKKFTELLTRLYSLYHCPLLKQLDRWLDDVQTIHRHVRSVVPWSLYRLPYAKLKGNQIICGITGLSLNPAWQSHRSKCTTNCTLCWWIWVHEFNLLFVYEARVTAYQAEATQDASMLGIAERGSLQFRTKRVNWKYVGPRGQLFSDWSRPASRENKLLRLDATCTL